MTILPLNSIPKDVAQYRKLKKQIDALKIKQAKLKAELAPIVEAQIGQKWTDGKGGYARIVHRKESVSYNNKALEALYESVPEIASAIGPHRKVKPSSSYLQIK